MVAFWFKGGGSSFHVQLEQANKSFARKAVSQIEAIPELEILISLSDNSLTVHELRSLKPLSGATQSLSNTKGANVFSVDVEVRYYVTFSVGGKERKFMFFDGRKFHASVVMWEELWSFYSPKMSTYTQGELNISVNNNIL